MRPKMLRMPGLCRSAFTAERDPRASEQPPPAFPYSRSFGSPSSQSAVIGLLHASGSSMILDSQFKMIRNENAVNECGGALMNPNYLAFSTIKTEILDIAPMRLAEQLDFPLEMDYKDIGSMLKKNPKNVQSQSSSCQSYSEQLKVSGAPPGQSCSKQPE
ncbi:hypothetical protein A6R68_02517, partial [Neotoma lepida]